MPRVKVSGTRSTEARKQGKYRLAGNEIKVEDAANDKTMGTRTIQYRRMAPTTLTSIEKKRNLPPSSPISSCPLSLATLCFCGSLTTIKSEVCSLREGFSQCHSDARHHTHCIMELRRGSSRSLLRDPTDQHLGRPTFLGTRSQSNSSENPGAIPHDVSDDQVDASSPPRSRITPKSWLSRSLSAQQERQQPSHLVPR